MSTIGVRVENEVREALEKIAADDYRTVSNLVRIIIIEWLENNKGIKIPKS